MEQINFIAIHQSALFTIIDGPHKGKNCFIYEIHFNERLVITKSGTVLPAEIVAPVLRNITDMGDTEAQLMYRSYWGSDPVPEVVEEKEYPWEVVKKPKPVKSMVMRLFQGKDHIVGEWNELMALIPFLIRGDFDFLKGEEKGWAVIKNRY